MSRHAPEYRIYETTHPWEPGVTINEVHYIDNASGFAITRFLTAMRTREEAEEFIARDRVAPVWDAEGDCRWCGIARDDLARYPAWWFGCILCETEIDRKEDGPAPEDHEYEPRHEGN